MNLEKNDRARLFAEAVIELEDVYDDVDVYTYKFADTRQLEPESLHTGSQSDKEAPLDRRMMDRSIEYWDTRVRFFLQSSLVDTQFMVTPGRLVYVVEFPEEVSGGMVKMLQKIIRRYIVWGVLYDWYSKSAGLEQASVYLAELRSIERDIINVLRVPSRQKRPMQPFGPAGKLL